MKVAFFDVHNYDRDSFQEVNSDRLSLTYFDVRLTEKTVALAQDFQVVCTFVNDKLSSTIIEKLARGGTKLIALRCAGFNQVDLQACKIHNIKVVRVPAYSPYAVAEHAMALLLTLNRKTHRAFNRVRELNCSLEGLTGFDLHGKTVGIVGLGKIGAVFGKICNGFGMKILVHDPLADAGLLNSLTAELVSFEELLKGSDIVSLHLPLFPKTFHLLNEKTISLMKPGAILINTSRGALIDSVALIDALKSRQVGGAGLDVYEEEEGIFFSDHSSEVLQDDVLARLLTFPNVVITSHQAFLTKEALKNIAGTTIENILSFKNGSPLANEVLA